VRLPYDALPAAVLRTDPHGWAEVLRDHAARPMPHVAHWDIRVDNLLRRPGGEIVFVDWGMAARGPAWAVTAFLAGMGAHLAVRSVVAVDVNLPTLNEFRIRESRRMLDAVSRRTGRTPPASSD